MTSLILSLACLLAVPPVKHCDCDVTGICTCGPNCGCLVLVKQAVPPVMPVDKFEWKQTRDGESYLWKNGTCIGGYNFAGKVYMTWTEKDGWNATPAKCPCNLPIETKAMTYQEFSQLPLSRSYHSDPANGSGSSCGPNGCGSSQGSTTSGFRIFRR